MLAHSGKYTGIFLGRADHFCLPHSGKRCSGGQSSSTLQFWCQDRVCQAQFPAHLLCAVWQLSPFVFDHFGYFIWRSRNHIKSKITRSTLFMFCLSFHFMWSCQQERIKINGWFSPASVVQQLVWRPFLYSTLVTLFTAIRRQQLSVPSAVSDCRDVVTIKTQLYTADPNFVLLVSGLLHNNHRTFCAYVQIILVL